jgi:hypothetical protein
MATGIEIRVPTVIKAVPPRLCGHCGPSCRRAAIPHRVNHADFGECQWYLSHKVFTKRKFQIFTIIARASRRDNPANGLGIRP